MSEIKDDKKHEKKMIILTQNSKSEVTSNTTQNLFLIKNHEMHGIDEIYSTPDFQ